MTKQLTEKKDKARKAIEDVHGDTSGPAIDNLDAIQEIIGQAEMIRDVLLLDVGESN